MEKNEIEPWLNKNYGRSEKPTESQVAENSDELTTLHFYSYFKVHKLQTEKCPDNHICNNNYCEPSFISTFLFIL